MCSSTASENSRGRLPLVVMLDAVAVAAGTTPVGGQAGAVNRGDLGQLAQDAVEAEIEVGIGLGDDLFAALGDSCGNTNISQQTRASDIYILCGISRPAISVGCVAAQQVFPDKGFLFDAEVGHLADVPFTGYCASVGTKRLDMVVSRS